MHLAQDRFAPGKLALSRGNSYLAITARNCAGGICRALSSSLSPAFQRRPLSSSLGVAALPHPAYTLTLTFALVQQRRAASDAHAYESDLWLPRQSRPENAATSTGQLTLRSSFCGTLS